MPERREFSPQSAQSGPGCNSKRQLCPLDPSLIPEKMAKTTVSIDMSDAISIDDSPPPVADYIGLRAACGWGEAPVDVSKDLLAASVAALTARNGAGEVVGFARATGDGLYLLITDVIVAPELRGQKLGERMMKRLLDRLRPDFPHATIMLMCAKGREAFYERLGFEARPTDMYGPGMHIMPVMDAPEAD